MNRKRNTDQTARNYEKFVYFIAKITTFYDYQTWQTQLFEKFTRYAKVFVFFVVDWLGRQTAHMVEKVEDGKFGYSRYTCPI